MIERFLLFAENRYARLVLVGLMFLGVQTTVFNDMRPFGVCLQIMVLLAVSAGLARGSDTGAIAGFIIGLLYDMVLTTPMGLCAAVFAMVGYLAFIGPAIGCAEAAVRHAQFFGFSIHTGNKSFFGA